MASCQFCREAGACATGGLFPAPFMIMKRRNVKQDFLAIDAEETAFTSPVVGFVVVSMRMRCSRAVL